MYNQEEPLIMHIDLNSCFATVEQQAHVTLRGQPVGIVNRRVENAMLITASYEAKERGVRLGMSSREARRIIPTIVLLESEPAKYRFIYHKLLDIMNDYSAHVRMKSIDEGVIDFHEAPLAIRQRGLVTIGQEIKKRLRNEVGEAMRCNIGIGANRFLAKTAAGLHKPDGLDAITHCNIRDIYATLQLTDITGINKKFEKRLNAVGIMTPLEFLDADSRTLETMVFKSVIGRQWYKRLRGWEVDKIDHPLRSIGRQYVLDGYRLSRANVLQRLHHLCEEVGGRLRGQGMTARGVSVFAHGYDGAYWQARHMSSLPFFSDQAIYRLASQLFSRFSDDTKLIGISCYCLEANDDMQFSLFGSESTENYSLMNAIDEVNNRYGRRTLFTAETVKSNQAVRQKIPFGSTRYL